MNGLKQEIVTSLKSISNECLIDEYKLLKQEFLKSKNPYAVYQFIDLMMAMEKELDSRNIKVK